MIEGDGTHHAPQGCLPYRTLRLLSYVLFVNVFTAGSVLSSTDDSHPMEIVFDAQDVAHVHAIVALSARPETVFAVLTDYARWPSLFGNGMIMAAIHEESEGVVTEMYVPRVLLPGTLHVIIRTRIHPPHHIEAELISGDLNHFWRLWRLMPVTGGRETRADLQMAVQPKSWAPQWVIRYGIKRELTDHFERLRAAVRRREG